MKISFLIRTLNEAEYLQKTLDLIKEQIGKHTIEIIIVDSGSTDNTLQIAKMNGCKILTIRQQEWSWGRTLNYGFEAATSDYVIILSAHCFLTTKYFLYRLEQLIIKNQEVAAFYGRQLPLDYYDPFEEYELDKFFPDIDLTMTSQSELIGISNAFSIVKRSIWEKYRYNENVASSEDFIWANQIIKHYNLVYTNELSVFHSHKFNPEYIYRKWYWRLYESQKIIEQYVKTSWLKSKIKFLIFIPYILFVKSFAEEYIIYNLLKKKYESLQRKDVHCFVQIKYRAILNAYYDYKLNLNKNNSFWTLKIPNIIGNHSKKLKDLSNMLESYRR